MTYVDWSGQEQEDLELDELQRAPQTAAEPAVQGGFVEYAPGKWVRAAKVRAVDAFTNYRGTTYCILDMAPGEAPGTGYTSWFLVEQLVAALNRAVTNERGDAALARLRRR